MDFVSKGVRTSVALVAGRKASVARLPKLAQQAEAA